jgi:RecB family exonuclease
VSRLRDEQLGFSDMPVRLYSAAPSRLMSYLDCPRRYRMAYLDRPTPPKSPPWGHNSVGAAVHTALAKWWDLPVEQRTPEAGGVLLLRSWLADGFRDDTQREDARERARAQVERYLDDVDPTQEPIGVERTVSLKTPRAALWGRVDRIDDRPGEGIVVVDYKTGRSVLTVDDARTSLALAVYAAASARTFHRSCTRVELHHLPTGEVAVWEHTEETLHRHLRRADSIAAEVAALDERFKAGMSPQEADEAFPAHVGPLCGWCDFNRACETGRTAVPLREPWAGVVTEDRAPGTAPGPSPGRTGRER